MNYEYISELKCENWPDWVFVKVEVTYGGGCSTGIKISAGNSWYDLEEIPNFGISRNKLAKGKTGPILRPYIMSFTYDGIRPKECNGPYGTNVRVKWYMVNPETGQELLFYDRFSSQFGSSWGYLQLMCDSTLPLIKCDCNGVIPNAVPEIVAAAPDVKDEDCKNNLDKGLHNSLGYFKGEFKNENMFDSTKVEVCYDAATKKWRTGYNTQIVLNSKIRYCKDNLLSKIMLNNISDLDFHINNMSNDALKLEKAKELIITLWGHTNYIVQEYNPNNKYFLKESLTIHEYEHYIDFTKWIDTVKAKINWDNIVSNFRFADSVSTDCDDMLNKAKNHYSNRRIAFRNSFVESWDKDYLRTSPNNTSGFEDIETKIDKRETNKAKIAEYQKYLFAKYKKLINTKINDPRYPGMKTIGDFYTGNLKELKEDLGVK